MYGHIIWNSEDFKFFKLLFASKKFFHFRCVAKRDVYQDHIHASSRTLYIRACTELVSRVVIRRSYDAISGSRYRDKRFVRSMDLDKHALRRRRVSSKSREIQTPSVGLCRKNAKVLQAAPCVN